MIETKWPIQTSDGYRYATVPQLIVLHAAGFVFVAGVSLAALVIRAIRRE